MDLNNLTTEIFSLLGFEDAQISVSESEEEISISITVSEEHSGMLIGYRGEKINALQFIISLMINNQTIAYRPVQLDINSYRQKRNNSLKEMADSAVQNALDSGREILLPPLPNYERRIIHMYLDGNKDVDTYSEGENDQRRLVIRPISTK